MSKFNVNSKGLNIANSGTVSAGTMRLQDLIPQFIAELRFLERTESDLVEIEKRMESDGYYDSDDSIFDLEFLFDMLDEHSPSGYYFGAHSGNASDYGFWGNDDFVEDEEDSDENESNRCDQCGAIRKCGLDFQPEEQGKNLCDSCSGENWVIW